MLVLYLQFLHLAIVLPEEPYDKDHGKNQESCADTTGKLAFFLAFVFFLPHQRGEGALVGLDQGCGVVNKPAVNIGKAVGQILNALFLTLHLLKGLIIYGLHMNLSLLGGRAHFLLVLLKDGACAMPDGCHPVLYRHFLVRCQVFLCLAFHAGHLHDMLKQVFLPLKIVTHGVYCLMWADVAETFKDRVCFHSQGLVFLHLFVIPVMDMLAECRKFVDAKQGIEHVIALVLQCCHSCEHGAHDRTAHDDECDVSSHQQEYGYECQNESFLHSLFYFIKGVILLSLTTSFLLLFTFSGRKITKSCTNK